MKFVLILVFTMSFPHPVGRIVYNVHEGERSSNRYCMTISLKEGEGVFFNPTFESIRGSRDIPFSLGLDLEFDLDEEIGKANGDFVSSYSLSYGDMNLNGYVSMGSLVDGQIFEDYPVAFLPSGIVFEWNQDLENYNRSFQDEYLKASARDLDIIRDLAPRLDLSSLLAVGDVEQGDTWDIPISTWEAILFPIGDYSNILPSTLDTVRVDPDMNERAKKFYKSNLQGESGGTYQGLNSVNGREVMEIGLDLEATTTVRLSSILDSLATAFDDGIDSRLARLFSFLGSTDAEIALVAEGVLLWDAKKEGLVSINLDFEFSIIHSTPLYSILFSRRMGEYGVGDEPGGFIEGTVTGTSSIQIIAK